MFAPSTIRLALPFLALGLAAAGCGEVPTRVRGVVKYQAEPLPNAFLTFRAADGKAYTANTGPDGRYEAAGVPPGPVAVIVQGHLPAKPQTDAATLDRTGRKVSDVELARSKAGPEPGPPLPEKYQDPAKSGLTFEMAGPEFEYNIDLK